MRGEIEEEGHRTGSVVWITGLSGAGKSTLASAVFKRLRSQGRPAVLLDGDALRDALGAAGRSSASYDPDARLELAITYSRLCAMLADQGLIVVIATISLFREVHARNRDHLPNYFEVYLRVPHDELVRRDSKGLYGQVRRDASTSGVVGVDVPYEEPVAADLVVDSLPPTSVDVLAADIVRRITGGVTSATP